MKQQRLLSLDIYRGITIAFMIIVNTPGSWSYVYPPLRHSEWHGCTPTDMVFPSFLFIVGVSMWFSLKKYRHNLSINSIIKILYRTAVIFLAGFLLQLFPFVGNDPDQVRIMGVLQRIALAYGFGALICLLIRPRYLILTGSILLLLYWALLGLMGGNDPYSLNNNFALIFDKIILGENHLYKGFGIPFDPEGLFSTIPAIVTVIIGFLAGGVVGKGSPDGIKVIKLVFYGAVCVGAGLIWSIWLPINKPLWTSSYALYTGGLSLLILAILYLFIDLFGLKGWSNFFRVFGINALFIYIMSGLWTKTMLLMKIPVADNSISLYSWIYSKLCVPLLGDLNGSLMFAIIQVLLMWMLGYLLYKRKIYIKV